MSGELSKPHESDPSTAAWFKQASLELLAEQLATRTYPGYPSFDKRLVADRQASGFEPPCLPDGAWETGAGRAPDVSEQLALSGKGVRLDANGRPLHPWFDDMLHDPRIGVVTGQGAYWRWGPNYTADAIVLRHDLAEPRLLLVRRRDTSQWALPGGFVDPGEDSLSAALREVAEETKRAGQPETTVPLASLNPAITPVYCGPLADLRVTANAWPETSAYRFDLSDQAVARLPIEPYAVDDKDKGATLAAWIALDQLQPIMFGSHRLLIELSRQLA